MEMLKISLTPDSKQLNKIITFLGKSYFPNAIASLHSAANYVQKIWVDKIRNSNAKRGWKPGYINSISIFSKDTFSTEVSASGRNVNFIENGIQRFDMKENRGKKGGLLYSPQPNHPERVGRFRVIYMRKDTPQSNSSTAMPNVIYSKASKLPFDRPLTNITSIKFTNKAKMTGKQKNDLEAGYYEGLIKSKKGGYGTFRIISKNSKGWIYPGVQAVKIYPIVAKEVPIEAKKIMNEGLQADLAEGLKYLKK
jgi:hypothetical protein